MRRIESVLIALAGCASPVSESEPELVAAATTSSDPRLELADALVPFAPGLLGYDRDRGNTQGRRTFQSFGVTTRSVSNPIDLSPHDDVPDAKMRVRITLTDVTPPIGNPSGSVTVSGLQWNRNLDGTVSSTPYNEAISIAGQGAHTTTRYFDQITSIDTAGLGVNCELAVEWWNGHEQEMGVSAVIAGVTDPASCEDDWRVYFNGQQANQDWDPMTSQCVAGLLPGAVRVNGVTVSGAAYRGLYFPVAPDFQARDTYHHFAGNAFSNTAQTWTAWLGTVGYGSAFFAVDDHGTNETRIRPLTVQLERQSDLAIVDSARWMMPITIDPSGARNLPAMLPGVESPGAIAQLSPRGLDRLQPTHADTLPYPIVPAGTQPRLSRSAIAVPHHLSDEVDVDLDALPQDDLDYWTEPNPTQPNDGEFAGYLAYHDMLTTAKGLKVAYDLAIKTCNGTPNPALCKAGVNAISCVQHDPKPDDFRIHVTGVDTFFAPARTEDALVIGDVTNMDLAFGTNQVLASFRLADVQGWLDASITPDHIELEWTSGPIACTIKPAKIQLSDYTDADDYNSWLACRDLSFAAGSGSLGAPIAFDVRPDGEKFSTPYAPGTPQVSLASITTDPGNGICADSWLSQTITDSLVAWETAVESTIAVELVTSPGEDEALDRLLSPYELGVTRIDAPPPGTPAYDVHPLATYDLSARLAKTAPDSHGAQANATDGLYLPYITRSAPVGNTVAYPTWFCPVAAGQFCDGIAGSHEPMLEGGLDPAGAQYDVSINYTTAHISHALWAQARREDRLGSPGRPGRLVLADTAVANRAAALGYTDVVAALAAVGTRFGVRFHQEAAPYAIATDPTLQFNGKLIYTTPNIVVELVSIASDNTESVVAKMMVDVVDYDHKLAFRTAGAANLDATWGQLITPGVTTTFLPGCYGGSSTCAGRLLAVVGSYWLPAVLPLLIDLMEQAPALPLFDAAHESGRPRHLKNIRTFLQSEGVVLLGDLCNPADIDCD